MKRDTQHPVRIQVSGEEHVGHYEVGPFQHGGHTITVFYRGQKKTDQIPPEVNHDSYTDSLAEGLLKQLVIHEEPIQPPQTTTGSSAPSRV